MKTFSGTADFCAFLVFKSFKRLKVPIDVDKRTYNSSIAALTSLFQLLYFSGSDKLSS